MLKVFALTMTTLILAAPSPVEAHGGGCRDNSPKGQCCHKDSKTGKVHCHPLQS